MSKSARLLRPWSAARAARWVLACTVFALGGNPAFAAAASVGLAGKFGDQALLVIDGGAPRTLRIGQTVQGVKLLALSDQQATVEVSGQKMQLGLGAAPLSVGATAAQRTVLFARSNGQFVTECRINGELLRMMVDTGATRITLSREQAQRLGINLQNGRASAVNTANGTIPATLIDLDKVRVGHIELHNVPAVVINTPMPYALLGMSFLQRVNMQHDGDRMTLSPRY